MKRDDKILVKGKPGTFAVLTGTNVWFYNETGHYVCAPLSDVRPA